MCDLGAATPQISSWIPLYYVYLSVYEDEDCYCFFVFVIFSENVACGTNVRCWPTYFGVTQQKQIALP